jgi:hypothetical protein
VDTRKKREWEINLSLVPQCGQRQDSVAEQLRDLVTIANRFGFYDAADAVQRLDKDTVVSSFRMDELDAVMMSVDKFFDVVPKDNPATRASTMRETVLKMLERQQDEITSLRQTGNKLAHEMNQQTIKLNDTKKSVALLSDALKQSIIYGLSSIEAWDLMPLTPENKLEVLKLKKLFKGFQDILEQNQGAGK